MAYSPISVRVQLTPAEVLTSWGWLSPGCRSSWPPVWPSPSVWAVSSPAGGASVPQPWESTTANTAAAITASTASGRRGEKLSGVTDIAIHYVGNPGTTAQQNHDYYDQPDTTVSSHFLIGLDGEIIQCIPMDEKSSATNDRNLDTLSIEVCHPDATGQFTQASYDALVKLTAWLCDYCGIGRDHVIRHYDVTGKLCPLYFVDHPDAWTQFLADVKDY